MKTIGCFLFFIVFTKGISQNTCATALLVTSGLYTILQINGSEAPNPICAPNGAVLPANNPAGEWYKFIATSNEAVTVSTNLPQNTGKDTRVHIYKGNCGALECIIGDDDSGGANLSVVTFNVFAGNTYYIAFDNKWSLAGFDFTVSKGTSLPVTFNETIINNSNPICCVVDMNNDFLDDIVSVATNQMTIMYQQTNGGFNNQNFALSPNVKIADWSIASGDMDKNNYNDIALGNSDRVTIIKANATGTAYTPTEFPQNIFSQKVNFVDINNDGNLDLWVCHDTAQSFAYRNDGSGNLVLDHALMPTLNVGGNYSAVWTDYNNDDRLDLYVSKCKGGVPATDIQRINLLYKNNGDGTFTEVGAMAGVNDGSQSWATAIEDFDTDGDLDFLVTNVSDTNKLYRNDGDGTFTNVFASSGIDSQTGSLEIQTADFNNDGLIDFIWQNTKQLYINNGNLTFTGYLLNVNEGGIGDFNNDGFLDIQFNNKIFYAVPNSNNWLKVNLKGIQSNSNGIGARVEIYGSWGKQIREVRSGQGFAHMSSLSTYFGIGSATQIEKLVIKWPSGKTDTIISPEKNKAITVTEGNSSLHVKDYPEVTFSSYPNPTKNNVTINSQHKIIQIHLYDSTGRLLQSKTENSDSASINLEKHAKGIYLLKIKTEAGIGTRQIIKE